ncbi:MAG: alanine racemase [bacterium]
MSSVHRPVVAEINLAAIRANIRSIRKMVGPSRKIMPVVKSDAYGLGAVPVARAIEPEVDALGVAFIYEGVVLRKAGIRCPILVMGGGSEICLEPAMENDLTLAVGGLHEAAAISRSAQEEGVMAKIHVEIDTGMGRLGLPWQDAVGEILLMKELPNMEVEGVFTHLATADIKQDAYTLLQMERFQQFLAELDGEGVHILIKHMANSAALLQYPQTWYDLVRPGLMIYGIYPASHLKDHIRLQFPLTLKTRIMQIRHMMEGDSISYGRTYTCQEQKRIAAVAVGYADGFGRVLSNRAGVLVKGCEARVVGTICMDISMIDITHIAGVEVQDEVILLGGEEGGLMVEKLAEQLGTISYEVLCSFGRRAERVYFDHDESERGEI